MPADLRQLIEATATASGLASIAASVQIASDRQEVATGVLTAAAGSDVSAADDAVVIALAGSTVTAWSGGVVLARGGASITLGAGGSAWIAGDSAVDADGWSGIEFRGRNGRAFVVAAGGAVVTGRDAEVIADDASVEVSEGMRVEASARAAVREAEPRGASLAVRDAFDASSAAQRLLVFRSSVSTGRPGPRRVLPAHPAPGQSREEWLAPFVAAVRAARRRLPLAARFGRLDWNDERRLIDEVSARLALPPTLGDRELNLALGRG